MAPAGKPLRIAGVSVIPKWNWTPAYTADVGESYGSPPGPKSQKERGEHFMARAEAYARWLAERQGIEIPKVAFIENIGGVIVFSELIEEHNHRAFTWLITARKPGSEFARIAIPNFGRLERAPDIIDGEPS